MTKLRDIPLEELLKFTSSLSTQNWKQFTEDDIARIGLFIATDGCSGVPDFYLDCCIIHDWFYRTHRDFNGNPVSKSFADKVFLNCIRKESWLGKASPMALWRYWAVKKFGKKAWDK